MIVYFYGDKCILMAVNLYFIKCIGDSENSSDSSDLECNISDDFAFSADVSAVDAAAKDKASAAAMVAAKN